MVFWMYMAQTPLGMHYIREAIKARGLRDSSVCDAQLQACGALFHLLATVSQKTISRATLDTLQAKINNTFRLLEPAFPKSQITIVHHMLKHVHQHILESGPLRATWTLYGERYGRFLRNLANVAKRSCLTVANGWQKWAMDNPVSAYNFAPDPSYEREDRQVTGTGRWKRLDVSEGTGQKLLDAMGVGRVRRVADFTYESGCRCVVNTEHLFRTSETESKCLTTNSIVLIRFEEKKASTYVAVIEGMARCKPRRGDTRQEKYVFFVKVKRTVYQPDSDMWRCDLNRPANAGASVGEWYFVNNIMCANPVLLPETREVRGRNGTLRSCVPGKFYVVNPREISNVEY
jgi:hypothetical protein